MLTRGFVGAPLAKREYNWIQGYLFVLHPSTRSIRPSRPRSIDSHPAGPLRVISHHTRPRYRFSICLFLTPRVLGCLFFHRCLLCPTGYIVPFIKHFAHTTCRMSLVLVRPEIPRRDSADPRLGRSHLLLPRTTLLSLVPFRTFIVNTQERERWHTRTAMRRLDPQGEAQACESMHALYTRRSI